MIILSKQTQFILGPMDRAWLVPPLWGAIALAIATIVVATAINAALELPKIPYNVRELFGGQNSWWKLIFFSLAVFSFGIGGTIAGHRTARSNVPLLTLPAMSILACIVTYLLLAACVTLESISDIAGSANTYAAVTQKKIWGETGAAIYTAIGSKTLIANAERVVRFIALVGPFFIWLAITTAVYFRFRGTHFVRPGARIPLLIPPALILLISGGVWHYGFKLIAFDYASTDNLDELIQDNGLYLYFLLILLPVNMVVVVHATISSQLRDVIVATVIVVISLPIGWILFRSGFSAPVEKYGLVFKGSDFLLGPDRHEILPQSILMMRWAAIQIAAIVTLAFGMRVLLRSKPATDESAD